VDTGERWHVERHGVVRRDGHGFSGPAGTAALNVATAPVKKLQASLRRDYKREHDEYKRELREYEVDKNG
jgi:hypothetical protein